MFAVEIWGTVGQWVSGCGTAGAALWGVGIYWRNSKGAKISQARLIGAHLAITPDHELLHLVVRNDSDRHISNFYFVHEENSLAKSLLRKSHFIMPEIRETPIERFDGEFTTHGWKHGGPEIILARRKAEVFGFDRRAGAVLLGGAELGPGGQERRYTTNVTTHRYRFSTEYWLVFQDANGNMWKLELEPKRSLASPRLKPVKSVTGSFRSFRNPALKPSLLSRLLGQPLHYFRVSKWLWDNRKEQTSSVRIWERESPDSTIET